MAKLHYDKEALLKDYRHTFGLMGQALLYGIGGVVVFLFLTIAYLGGVSHTPHKDFYDTFNDRFEIDYSGKKLPLYNQPEAALAAPSTQGE